MIFDDDHETILFLQQQGFVLQRGWYWTHPDNPSWEYITEDQKNAIWYLMTEWDFDGYSQQEG